MKTVILVVVLLCLILAPTYAGVKLSTHRHADKKKDTFKAIQVDAKEFTQGAIKTQNKVAEPTERSLGDYPSYNRGGSTSSRRYSSPLICDFDISSKSSHILS